MFYKKIKLLLNFNLFYKFLLFYNIISNYTIFLFDNKYEYKFKSW